MSCWDWGKFVLTVDLFRYIPLSCSVSVLNKHYRSCRSVVSIVKCSKTRGHWSKVTYLSQFARVHISLVLGASRVLILALVWTGGVENATKVVSSHFNDQNKENPSLYFSDVTKCDYLVDLKTDKPTELEPDFEVKYPETFEELTSFDYLDSHNSHRIFRAFYVPFYSSQFCKYSKYVLLRNTGLKKS